MSVVLSHLWLLALHFDGGVKYLPQMTREEEEECLRQISNGDDCAREQLVLHNQRLVSHIVNSRFNSFSEQDKSDLCSVGTIGLLKAAENFDSNSGLRFSTLAYKCIMNEMLMWLRKEKKHLSTVKLADPIASDENGESLTLLDKLESDLNVEEIAEKTALREKLNTLIDTVLDERERKVIRLRYGIDENGNHKATMSQKDVGKQLGISRTYVARIEGDSVKKMRPHFGVTKPNKKG
jgi:RNA polymerase sporulation-specific sigma factor